MEQHYTLYQDRIMGMGNRPNGAGVCVHVNHNASAGFTKLGAFRGVQLDQQFNIISTQIWLLVENMQHTEV